MYAERGTHAEQRLCAEMEVPYRWPRVVRERAVEFARAGSAANLERVVRGWKALDRKSEVTAEQIRHRSRRLSAWVDDDGMVVVNGRLDPEVGALFDAPAVTDRPRAGISPESGADLGWDGGREAGGPRQLRPRHLEGASRWKCDGEIPWAVEARAWEALDSG